MAGGTGSIGRGVVEGLGRAGVPVLFTYLGAEGRNSEAKAAALVEELTAKGYQVRARRMDMRNVDEIEAALDEVEAWTGRVHSVMTAAGAPVPFAKTADYTPEQIDDFIAGDALSYFRLFRSAVQRMRKSGGGSIACTTTIDVGKLALYNGASGMSKGAVEAMMRHIAVEEAQANIRANYVRIGWVGDDSYADHQDWLKPQDGEPRTQMEMLASIGRSHMLNTPMQRPGSLREAGDVFAFLASDQASYLTGQCIQMDGGEDR
ncbi:MULTISPECIES: SDR family NAD(P)-dependent oxidoreductase [Sphingobium]|uniref:SDR family NAD(P)-dependent oxidoreductase n=1 Tax=Sphingobium sp. MI1205 TaxID=407020 RepID=UPI000770547F|nr:SDR family oxidoreductase [Sphingobium sp. MI1205]AMK16867.1 dehydrogenase [Sphingobium sp. MI1205]